MTNAPVTRTLTALDYLAAIGIGVLLAAVFFLGDRMTEHGPLWQDTDAHAVTTATVAPASRVIELDAADAEHVNYCTDGLPVYVDTDTGTVFGDQDGDGVLSGPDCDWQ
ncbi:putative membrane protein [Rhodococcus phage Mbo2]|uniref:Membrane protein n=1 Tax=Rhodococcus phage Mbo2 TaxID=2936911 RepID=A0A9E7LF41_9CAUD|nr:putative membrane protein [Rhodococcus phage Mbo2]